MKKGGGKQKGSSFERYIAKELSLWITKGKYDKVFWRTHSSGGLGTVSKCKSEYGDIMAIDDIGRVLTSRFNIECRCGRFVKIRDLVYSSPEQKSIGIVEFISEGKRNALASGRSSLWFLREHSRPVLVLIELPILIVPALCVFPVFSVYAISFGVWKDNFQRYYLSDYFDGVKAL